MTEAYTPEERQNLVGDIARWEVELEEVGAGGNYSPEDIRDIISDLYEMSDSDLQSYWEGTVGEWVLSRRDMPIPEDVDAEDWLNDQFESLLRGDGVPWGYASWFEAPLESELTA